MCIVKLLPKSGRRLDVDQETLSGSRKANDNLSEITCVVDDSARVNDYRDSAFLVFPRSFQILARLGKWFAECGPGDMWIARAN
ncbi:predicted protein [Chaetomium globosum CBS 148.51]|uniref:Uncharacterized protein n=1 Tax=Chaetomium globosum (strain ATCC 6205 / CBS 148.51 / DSM 1962 / NBRC 6347 / NRRL 1970) TaxID=306901 RepID=Q2HAA9_CHAGB|nr:uncharacterized protein CHGG_02845 [Chaetomium globosum CBS 148.51]EAQ90910.1 predicted protein [Chaetomium globosum CBS 148.51]